MSKKAILISIKPKYVAKILNGEKTIEIRKTMPKCDLPIDVYIYCTKQNAKHYIKNKIYNSMINGKVVAKFTLNKVEEITNRYCKGMLIDSCLTNYELNEYLGNNIGYAWHISNLGIFDKPKELSEFGQYGYEWFIPIEKAPQSWCYVEVE